ncbi:MAG: response regulator transcription factor [Dechloromonas sp.]|nr:response regulator transcription factor [Dechloromonas sp.]
MKLRVLLADDHALFRQALSLSLEVQPDLAVVAAVDSGAALLAAFAAAAPDVVCVDVNMPGMNGIEVTRQLLARHPAARVVGLSADGSPAQAAAMVAAGARGYVIKMNAGSELPDALRRVARGAEFLSPELGVGSLDELAAYLPPG